MPAELLAPDLTDDAVLDGRLRLLQPRRGHRFGHDAILLAAATDAHAGERAADFGAGVGAAGLALAIRVPGLNVTLVEREVDLAALAAENARRNGLGDRAGAVALDVTAPAQTFAAAGLGAGSFDCVLMNPPFHDAARTNASPQPARRAAHVAPPGSLAAWIETAQRLLGPGGRLTVIYRADGLADVLAALQPGFGGGALLPIYPKPAAAAIRVIVRAEKGSHGPLNVLPGLTLNDAEGRPTSVADDILRRGAQIALNGAK